MTRVFLHYVAFHNLEKMLLKVSSMNANRSWGSKWAYNIMSLFPESLGACRTFDNIDEESTTYKEATACTLLKVG